jgi:hypothetical protein
VLVTYNQVADENLHDLCLQTRSACEYLLQDANQNVTERCADECAVDGHLGHARREVMPVLVLVVRNPRREDLLEAGEGTRRQHLGAERIRLQLLEVCLRTVSTHELNPYERDNCPTAR